MEYLTKEQPWKNGATFDRDTVAYLSDGTQVAIDQARYEKAGGVRGLLIEEGTENTIASSRLKFESWTPREGAVVTLTQGQTVPEWGTGEATRIQTFGGDSLLKYYDNTVVPGSLTVDGQPYTASVKIKNIGSAPVVFDAQLGDKTVYPGETKDVAVTIIGDGAAAGQFRFEALTAGDDLDFIAYQPQWEEKAYATSWHDGTRDEEFLKLPTSLVSESEGTIELDVYLPDGPASYLTSIPAASGGNENRLYLYGSGLGTGDQYIRVLMGDGTTWAITPGIPISRKTWHRIAAIWTPTTLTIYAGNSSETVARSGGSPTFSSEFFIGSSLGFAQANAYIGGCRISSVARSESEISTSETRSLGFDADTTALLTVPTSGEALLLRNDALTVPVPDGVRPYRRQDIKPQVLDHDSAGTPYVYSRGGKRIRHEPTWRMSAAQRDAFIAWLRDQAKGVRSSFTWIDYAGAPHTCKSLVGRAAPQALPNSRWQVSLPMEERL